MKYGTSSRSLFVANLLAPRSPWKFVINRLFGKNKNSKRTNATTKRRTSTRRTSRRQTQQSVHDNTACLSSFHKCPCLQILSQPRKLSQPRRSRVSAISPLLACFRCRAIKAAAALYEPIGSTANCWLIICVCLPAPVAIY